MKMIPSSPHSTDSSAERRVFDRLRGAFEQGRHHELTALHSLNLTRHAYKRFGEIDYVIVGPKGILVLEVKGGGISCQEGVWYSTRRTGARNRLKENPFRQAESAMHGLRKRLEADLAPGICAQFVWGYGVVFPDCDWSVPGAEWDQAAEIERLIGPGGLLPASITILSPRPFADSTAALLSSRLAGEVTELDEFALRQFPPARISFAQIASFKGLENEAVILIDLPAQLDEVRSITDYYVGMSRARSLLIAIFMQEGPPAG